MFGHPIAYAPIPLLAPDSLKTDDILTDTALKTATDPITDCADRSDHQSDSVNGVLLIVLHVNAKRSTAFESMHTSP